MRKFYNQIIENLKQCIMQFCSKKIFIVSGYKNRRMPNLLRNGSGDIITRRGMQRSPTYLNVSKNILARQSIFRTADCTIQSNQIKKMPAILTDQQIKQSSIYYRLIMRIQTVKRKQQEERIEHQKRIRQIEDELKKTKDKIKQEKLGLWEMRNEVMELEEVLRDQVEEYQELWDIINQEIMEHGEEQLVAEEEQEDDDNDHESSYEENDDDYIGQQQSQQGPNHNPHYHPHHHHHYPPSSHTIFQQQQSSSRYPTSQCTQSKPTCSIKLMISDRSITSPNNSNSQVVSELAPFVNQSRETYTENSMQQQHTSLQQQITQHNIISFKKQQPVFSHDD